MICSGETTRGGRLIGFSWLNMPELVIGRSTPPPLLGEDKIAISAPFFIDLDPWAGQGPQKGCPIVLAQNASWGGGSTLPAAPLEI